MTQETEPLLQTYWLPKTSSEEASGAFFGWILFAISTVVVIALHSIIGTTTF